MTWPPRLPRSGKVSDIRVPSRDMYSSSIRPRTDGARHGSLIVGVRCLDTMTTDWLPDDFVDGDVRPGRWVRRRDGVVELGEHDDGGLEVWRVRLVPGDDGTLCTWTQTLHIDRAFEGASPESLRPADPYRGANDDVPPEARAWVQRYLEVQRTRQGVEASAVNCSFCGACSANNPRLFIRGDLGSACDVCVDVMGNELASRGQGALVQVRWQARTRVILLGTITVLSLLVALAAIS